MRPTNSACNRIRNRPVCGVGLFILYPTRNFVNQNEQLSRSEKSFLPPFSRGRKNQLRMTSFRLSYFCIAAERIASKFSRRSNASSVSFFAVKMTSVEYLRFLMSLRNLPLWRVPRKSPLPRSSKSFSASANPSDVFLNTVSRSRAVSLSDPTKRKHQLFSLPRPTLPRS